MGGCNKKHKIILKTNDLPRFDPSTAGDAKNVYN